MMSKTLLTYVFAKHYPCEIVQESEVNDDPPPFVRPSLREDAPLASILNEQLDGVDPR